MKVSTEIAVDQINAAGGLLGRPIELIVEDEASDPAVAVDKARKLIEQDEVNFIVGTLISAVRNAVVEVTSAAKVPLFNPTYYEGGLCQEYFLSTGASAESADRTLRSVDLREPRQELLSHRV